MNPEIKIDLAAHVLVYAACLAAAVLLAGPLA